MTWAGCSLRELVAKTASQRQTPPNRQMPGKTRCIAPSCREYDPKTRLAKVSSRVTPGDDRHPSTTRITTISRRPRRCLARDSLVTAAPRGPGASRRHSLLLETLEDRTVLSVSILNNGGNGYAGLNFNRSGGYVPPDTSGAAGPSAYVETVNQAVALYAPRPPGPGHRQPLPLLVHHRRPGRRPAPACPTRSSPTTTRSAGSSSATRTSNFSTHVSTLRPRRLQDEQPGHADARRTGPSTRSTPPRPATTPTTPATSATTTTPSSSPSTCSASPAADHVQVVSVNNADLADERRAGRAARLPERPQRLQPPADDHARLGRRRPDVAGHRARRQPVDRRHQDDQRPLDRPPPSPTPTWRHAVRGRRHAPQPQRHGHHQQHRLADP